MMNDDVLKNQDPEQEIVYGLVSALADGQLRGDDFAKAVESIHSKPDCRAAWQSYHVIGDVLRSPELADQAGDPTFLARFQSRLAADPEAQLAYQWVSPVSASNPLIAPTAGRSASANQSVFAWKLTAGFASLAAVVAIGWSMANGLSGSVGGAQLAQAVPPAQSSSSRMANSTSSTGSVISESAVMIRDPNLDALLAAHKQFGGSSALQMPTGFLRNATFEGAAR